MNGWDLKHTYTSFYIFPGKVNGPYSQTMFKINAG